jgi:hypothetical protein
VRVARIFERESSYCWDTSSSLMQEIWETYPIFHCTYFYWTLGGPKQVGSPIVSGLWIEGWRSSQRMKLRLYFPSPSEKKARSSDMWTMYSHPLQWRLEYFEIQQLHLCGLWLFLCCYNLS